MSGRRGLGVRLTEGFRVVLWVLHRVPLRDLQGFRAYKVY